MITLPRRFLVAATAARLAPEGLAIGLVLVVRERTGGVADAGVLLACVTLPQFVLGPLSGTLLDRAARPWPVLAAASSVGAAAVAGLAVGAGRVPLVVAALAAVVVAATEPLLTGGLSATAGRTWAGGRPGRVQAWDSLAYNIAGLAAPAGVAALGAATGAQAAVLALAAGSASAAVVLVTVRPAPLPRPATDAARLPLREAIVALAAVGPLRATTVATTLAHGAIGALPFAAVAAAAAHGLDAARGGQLLVAVAVGGLLGSLVMTRVPLPHRADRLVLVALATMGAIALGIGGLGWAAVLGGAVAFGALDGPLLVGTYAVRLEHGPPTAQASVFTVAASLKLGAASVGALAGGFLLDGSATMAGVAAIGAAHLAAAAIGWLTGRGAGLPRAAPT